MIQINVLPKEVEQAKRITAEFDAQKTYNKFECSHNYIGYLGELVLDRYLTDNDISHEWVCFVKQGWTQPDFKINGLSVDLKTSYTSGLWFQRPIYDVYIQAQLNEDNTILTINGCISKELLANAQVSGKARKIEKNDRTDYVYDASKLYPLEVENSKIIFKY